MVGRIGTFASNQALITRMLLTQERVQQTQVQVSTEKKSLDYKGIAKDAFRLVSLENDRSLLDRYIQNNTIMANKLKLTFENADAANKSIRLMRQSMIEFSAIDIRDQSDLDRLAVQDIQTRAFQALKDLQFFLNEEVDGQHLFAGGRTERPPFSFPYQTLEEFQDVYDGTDVTFAETRAATLADAEFNNVTTTYGLDTFTSTGDVGTMTAAAGSFITGTINDTAFGDLTFSNTNGHIQAENVGAFSNLTPGMTLLIDGAGANNGVFTIQTISDDGRTVTVEPPPGADATVAQGSGAVINLGVPDGTTIFMEDSATGKNGPYTVRWPTNAELAAGGLDPATGAVVDGSVLFTTPPFDAPLGGPEAIDLETRPYYVGDKLNQVHRVDESRTLDVGVTANDPAFEKAVRALGIIAQGSLLDHPERAEEVLSLLNDSIRHSPDRETELPSDLEDVLSKIGANQEVIGRTLDQQKDFAGFISTRQTEVENVDVTEAAVRLNDDVRSLEVSFASLARIQRLSLNDFL